MEENLGSQQIPVTSKHISFNGEAQPIKFLRKEKIIPDLIAYYFFKKKDSTMSYILYEWDVSNFEKKDNNKKSDKFQKAMIKKYQKLKKDISKSFGKPKVKKNYSNISRLDPINSFVESSIWKPNDSTEIKMSATISNFYKKKGAITINPIHRIRLYIKNQKKKKIPKLDDEKLAKLDKIKTEFFKALRSNDIAESKKYLSDKIIDKVTDEQIKILIDNIDFNRKTELIYSGIQMGLNGNMYVLIQYKYSDDSSNPPKEFIKLIFDDSDKILGIQPMKEQNNK